MESVGQLISKQAKAYQLTVEGTWTIREIGNHAMRERALSKGGAKASCDVSRAVADLCHNASFAARLNPAATQPSRPTAPSAMTIAPTAASDFRSGQQTGLGSP
jgi:hypothetical protein